MAAAGAFSVGGVGEDAGGVPGLADVGVVSGPVGWGFDPSFDFTSAKAFSTASFAAFSAAAFFAFSSSKAFFFCLFCIV